MNECIDMKYFGTVKSFDVDQGIGSLKPETGGDDLKFERSAISWGDSSSPTV
jgi:cold shock CspA family protein